MSHELRTPLNSIMGFSQLLIMDPDLAKNTVPLENATRIYKSGKHLLDLINEILDLARIEAGRIKFSENADIGYYPQEHVDEFAAEMSLFDWMDQWGQESDDDQAIRGILGRLLFSRDDTTKSVKVLSGGEMGRMVYGKLMLEKPNVLFMDEPTNHMDMESIESLNMALESYQGTLVFVSHDREFVSSLATRILEMKENEMVDFKGTYDEYLASQGVEL
jgi:ATPase subunit of ABC transporter with duplicated ATPase domains